MSALQTSERKQARIRGSNGKTVAPVARNDLYCFGLTATIVQRYVGEGAGGYRLDLEYKPTENSVTMSPDSCLSPDAKRQIRNASLLSGSDWVFVSKEGVASFETRVTLQIGDGVNPEPALISGRIRGRADLKTYRSPVPNQPGAWTFPFTSRTKHSDVMSKWKSGFGEGACLPLALAVVFDVPAAGSDGNDRTEFIDCREIERSVLVGFGEATYGPGEHSPVASIELRIYKIGSEPGSAPPAAQKGVDVQ